MHASCRYHCKICRKFYLFCAFDSPKAKIVGESMRNQDKQARKFGVFSPIFGENFYNHFLNSLHTPVDANDFSHAYRHEIVNEVKNIP